MKNNRTHQCHCEVFFFFEEKRKLMIISQQYATIGPNLFSMGQTIQLRDMLRKDNYTVYIGQSQLRAKKNFF